MSTQVLSAKDFEMFWDADHTFPFIETEDAAIVAYGHPDAEVLAAQITEFDRLCGETHSDGWETDPEAIARCYAVLVDGGSGDDWSIRWGGVDASAAGAFPVSVVIR
jgi:hypothetical protein